MIKRRAFVAGMTAVVAAAPVVQAQRTSVARIGFLGDSPDRVPQLRDAFLAGLRDSGYHEGRNLVIEYRYADGKPERFGSLAHELAALQLDVIFVASTPAALAAKQASTAVPIVFTAISEPIASGLVASLARPGGNLTGFTFFSTSLVGKCLELLKDAVPGMSRVATLWQPGGLSERTAKGMLAHAQFAAKSLAVQLDLVEVRGPEDFDAAFSRLTERRVEAITILTSSMLFIERQRLVSLATANRLPTVFPWRDAVDGGGLMSYGPSLADLFRRAAFYVDRILKGTKPGDLPVEEPTKFELVVNLKTAKALGLTIPPSLLLRADQVIE